MKAIIEIELSIDGVWKKSDKKKLIKAIMDHPEFYGWTIDPNRLIVFSENKSYEVVE